MNSATAKTNEVTYWLEARAREVLSGAELASFLALPAKSQAVGIATMASVSGDAKVRAAAVAAFGAL